MTVKLDQALSNAVYAYRTGYLAQAEILCRAVLTKRSNDPIALNLLGQLSRRLGMRDHAIDYFRRAVTADPNFKAASQTLTKVEAEGRTHGHGGTEHTDRFVLIKAWGYGFFSDVDHVLGALLLAELTGRIPVVHWGNNSLFSDGTGGDAFTQFFKAVSDKTIDDLLGYSDASYFPPKWISHNLLSEEVNKWKGSYSRMAGLYFFNRTQKVIVSDFHIGVVELLPWIEAVHPLYGLSIEELYRYLINKYLVPKRQILDEVDDFFRRYLSDGSFISVHMRGSDKVSEQGSLDKINRSYFREIGKLIINGPQRIFLLTDSAQLLSAVTERYGDRVIYTQCQRTANDLGIHQQQLLDNRVRVGVEVLKDVYLAARANWFIGNGRSNPSCMIKHLKEWEPGACVLLVPSQHDVRNTYIHFQNLDASSPRPFMPTPL